MAKQNIGLSILDEIKAAKGAKKERKGKGGENQEGDGRADADLTKRIVDNSFAFKSKEDGTLVVDVTTTYPMKGRKPKCRIAFSKIPDLCAALMAVHAGHEATMSKKADDFAAEREAEQKG